MSHEPAPRRGKLAIVVGIDGAGKSTVMRRLAWAGYQTSHWRRLADLPSALGEEVRHAAERMEQLRGADRTAFIVRLVEGEWEWCIQPRLVAGLDVVCDGFFLRPLVKEQVFGDGDLEALRRASPLSGEELVVMIDVPVAVAVGRKRGQPISRYECFSGPDDFAAFQERQRDELLRAIRGRNHRIVDGTRDEEAIAREVESILAEHGIAPGPA